MAKKKLPYSEGSVFLVPLTRGGYARGVVARASPKGRILFGYFFGPRLTSTDTVEFDDLDPAWAILRVMFGDLGLINGNWPVRGQLSNWDRSWWRMPDFAVGQLLEPRAPTLIRYSDTDPARVEASYRIKDDTGMPVDGLYGADAVVTKLANLLDREEK
jgi:immunity protein 26 of polymorphic toxin system